MSARPLPLVGIPTCVRILNERPFFTAADRYPNAVADAAGCLPLLIPALGTRLDCAALLDTLDGLLLTGSPSNVEPCHYGGEPSQEGTLHDPARDATTLPLIREAIRRDLPILAICRGIQELNVALGGTLHQRVHELPGRLNHRSPPGPMPLDQRYGPAHLVQLTPGGLFAGLAGCDQVVVNSLHSQGIDRAAPGLRVEAVAPDGQIEGVCLPDATFVVGVQWHPEYKPLENPLSRALFAAFGRACRGMPAELSGESRAA
ncbi:MAG: gamma-glutamyl-gamma-aminobutyrate hydrolase family protein [Alphaproteobacteria bacterium]|nr:gamma-glutamyl-gamma-aminobutyrate hydrolase family protein [Alphaproteobacteria bacterium]